jgi:hypothetical protein
VAGPCSHRGGPWGRWVCRSADGLEAEATGWPTPWKKAGAIQGVWLPSPGGWPGLASHPSSRPASATMSAGRGPPPAWSRRHGYRSRSSVRLSEGHTWPSWPTGLPLALFPVFLAGPDPPASPSVGQHGTVRTSRWRPFSGCQQANAWPQPWPTPTKTPRPCGNLFGKVCQRAIHNVFWGRFRQRLHLSFRLA